MLILEFLTRIAAMLLAIEMAVAIWKVHSAGGYLAMHNYEFPLALAAACFALATVGAGRRRLTTRCMNQAEGGSGKTESQTIDF